MGDYNTSEGANTSARIASGDDLADLGYSPDSGWQGTLGPTTTTDEKAEQLGSPTTEAPDAWAWDEPAVEQAEQAEAEKSE